MPSRPTALILDDNPDDACLMSRLLQHNGFDTRCGSAQSLTAIRGMLEEQPWDAVICDYSLGNFNARDVAAIISEHRLAIPLVIVSGCEREIEGHEFVLKEDLSSLLPSIERARARVRELAPMTRV